jgi:hypothetical protein
VSNVKPILALFLKQVTFVMLFVAVLNKILIRVYPYTSVVEIPFLRSARICGENNLGSFMSFCLIGRA